MITQSSLIFGEGSSCPWEEVPGRDILVALQGLKVVVDLTHGQGVGNGHL